MMLEQRVKIVGVLGRLKVVIEYTPESMNKRILLRCYRELCEAIERPDFVKELRERLEKLGQSAAEE